MRGVEDEAVHGNFLSVDPSTGIEVVTALGDGPFVSGEAGVILGVDDGEFALGQRYVSCALHFRWQGGSAGFEVAAAILRPNDEVFAFAALLVGAYQDGSILGRGLFGITTILTCLSFHDLSLLK